MKLKHVLLAAATAVTFQGLGAGPALAQDDRLPKDRACILDCREVHSRCTHAAYSNARLCVGSCGDLIAEAREICAEAPDSERCDAARREAAACVRTCRQTASGDLRQCFAGAKECVSLCPDAEVPAPADPICLHECRRQARACLDRANAAARECAEPCGDLVQRARRVCAEAPRSEECAQARREASACLQPCRERLASQTGQCIADGQRCAASCPPEVDSTDRRARDVR